MEPYPGQAPRQEEASETAAGIGSSEPKKQRRHRTPGGLFRRKTLLRRGRVKVVAEKVRIKRRLRELQEQARLLRRKNRDSTKPNSP